MSYDFEHYSGKYLKAPKKPEKPSISRNPTAIEARAYADALDEYEKKIVSYKDELVMYNNEKDKLHDKFRKDLSYDYGLSTYEFAVIWDAAYQRAADRGDTSLAFIYDEFEAFFNFAKRYASSMKGV